MSYYAVIHLYCKSIEIWNVKNSERVVERDTLYLVPILVFTTRRIYVFNLFYRIILQAFQTEKSSRIQLFCSVLLLASRVSRI